MNVPYDLSDVLFICTANTTDTIPEPLLNRMEVLNFQGYTETEKLQIAKKHLLPKALENAGLSETQLEVPDGLLRKIIADYTMEAGRARSEEMSGRPVPDGGCAPGAGSGSAGVHSGRGTEGSL